MPTARVTGSARSPVQRLANVLLHGHQVALRGGRGVAGPGRSPCTRPCAAVGVEFGNLEKAGKIGVLRHEGRALAQVDVDVVIHRVGQRGRRDQGHHGDQPLHEHRPVADQPDVALPADHLGRRARRDQGVEPGNRPAHDANKYIREYWAVEVGSSARGEMGVDRRGLELGVGDDHSQHQQHDRADLEQAGQIVAWAEQQPDRQHGRDEAVTGQGEDRAVPGKREVWLDAEPGTRAPGGSRPARQPRR